jgi:hypothetical protein
MGWLRRQAQATASERNVLLFRAAPRARTGGKVRSPLAGLILCVQMDADRQVKPGSGLLRRDAVVEGRDATAVDAAGERDRQRTSWSNAGKVDTWRTIRLVHSRPFLR